MYKATARTSKPIINTSGSYSKRIRESVGASGMLSPTIASAALNSCSPPRTGGWFEESHEPRSVTKVMIPASTEINRVIAPQLTEGFAAR